MTYAKLKSFRIAPDLEFAYNRIQKNLVGEYLLVTDCDIYRKILNITKNNEFFLGSRLPRSAAEERPILQMIRDLFYDHGIIMYRLHHGENKSLFIIGSPYPDIVLRCFLSVVHFNALGMANKSLFAKMQTVVYDSWKRLYKENIDELMSMPILDFNSLRDLKSPISMIYQYRLYRLFINGDRAVNLDDLSNSLSLVQVSSNLITEINDYTNHYIDEFFASPGIEKNTKLNQSTCIDILKNIRNQLYNGNSGNKELVPVGDERCFEIVKNLYFSVVVNKCERVLNELQG